MKTEKTSSLSNEARLKNLHIQHLYSVLYTIFKHTYNSGKINVETSLVDGRNCTDRTHKMGKLEVPVVKLTDIIMLLVTLVF